MTFDHLAIAVLTGLVAVLFVVIVILLDRLESDRKACRTGCPLVETVQSQLRSLSYAWGELDRHAKAKREDTHDPRT